MTGHGVLLTATWTGRVCTTARDPLGCLCGVEGVAVEVTAARVFPAAQVATLLAELIDLVANPASTPMDTCGRYR